MSKHSTHQLNAGASSSNGTQAPERLDANISDFVSESYEDIQLPRCDSSSQLGIRHLTHPSKIGKKTKGSKNHPSGNRSGGRATSVKKRKRRLEDRQDVFDHLATLLRKQRSQIQSQLNVQEVPLSPRVDPTPCDYPSLHSTQFPDDEQGPTPDDEQGPTPDDEQGLPMAKRVLFAPDLCCYDDEPLVVSSGAHSVFTEREGSDVGPSASDTLLDQALEDEEIVWSELEAAQVPILDVGTDARRPHLLGPSPFPPPHNCAAEPAFSIFHCYPREE